MRQKELRLALICYGGISLAVYMHGITKEIWHLAKASRNFHDESSSEGSSEAIYHDLMMWLEQHSEIKIRVLTDIIAGASAGGINGIFLAQAISTGQSLEPLTDMWLEKADVDVLLAADARPLSRFSKFWAEPIAWYFAGRKGGTVEQTVSKEAREEVKSKLSRFVRARWFAPPFGGTIFTDLLYSANMAMEKAPHGKKLLPQGQPLDLFVTVTDFKGHKEKLRLHSPTEVIETEHRITIGFSTRDYKKVKLAGAAELTFAARATASFPGAFPPFTVKELDGVLHSKGEKWPNRGNFLKRILPNHFAAGTLDEAVLVDGSILANAPFKQAIDALRNRPARREIDRRFVYIDPKPDLNMGSIEKNEEAEDEESKLPGFFSTIFGAISNIPREQPIRDNLDEIERRSNRIIQMRKITDALRPEVEQTVEALFGRTLFLDNPTPKRLASWRSKAQDKAARASGFAYPAYGHLKLTTIIDEITAAARRPHADQSSFFHQELRETFTNELNGRGLDHIAESNGSGASEIAIDFFRKHDLGFRIRRLRFLARRLNDDVETGESLDESVTIMRDTIYKCLSIYIERETEDYLGEEFTTLACAKSINASGILDKLAERRDLIGADARVDAQLSAAFAHLPKKERRSMLLAYLGFPFYDIATLPLLQGEGLDEFDPIKVDRISPEDATTIRGGGAAAMLKGIEFNNFGAFFSRSYRENDYLWGRLHGADRLVDIILSAVPETCIPDKATILSFKKRAFHAILNEEEARLTKVTSLITQLRDEIG